MRTRYYVPVRIHPLILFRYQEKERGKPGGLNWRKFLRAFTPLCRTFNMTRREVFDHFEPLHAVDVDIYGNVDNRLTAVLDETFKGLDSYGGFQLWELNKAGTKWKKIREATEKD